jgi:DNA-binding NarL/FixJ family response regulator
MVTILVVDEHPFMRRVIREALEKESDLEVVVEAVSSQDAGWQAAQVRPDVVVMTGALASEILASLRPHWQSQPSYANTVASISYQPQSHPDSRNQSTRWANLKTPRPLTEREKEILGLVCCGRKDREIANELCIAESTVHKHVQNILGKLQVRNRAEAIRLMSLKSIY